MKNEILQGDALTVLQTLADESVDCVITSPPYWGLRDYGTAKWEGGDVNCDHKEAKEKSRTDAPKWKDVCPSCGAVKKDGQLGLEKTPEEYVEKLVKVFREVKRVLKKEGTVWLNLGDSYANTKVGNTEGEIAGRHKHKLLNAMKFKKEIPPNLKPKDLVGIPWRVAFALQADWWYLRQDIIWAKPNPMPESVTDRCTKSHEYIFLLSKSPKYYFNNGAIKEPATYALSSGDHRPPGIVRDRLYGYDSKEAELRGRKVSETKNGITIRHPQGKHGGAQQSPKTLVENRNKRSVWTVTTKPYREAHFATFPPDLIIPMIKAGCPEEGIVLDPFAGSGTTLEVARSLGRNYLGIELNPEHIKLINKRLSQDTLL